MEVEAASRRLALKSLDKSGGGKRRDAASTSTSTSLHTHTHGETLFHMVIAAGHPMTFTAPHDA